MKDRKRRSSHPPAPSCQDSLFSMWATLRMLSRRERRMGNGASLSATAGRAGEKSGFFSILSENYFRVRTDWSAKLTRGLGKRPNNITPATAHANTKERVGEVTRCGGATEEGLGSRIYITITTLM